MEEENIVIINGESYTIGCDLADSLLKEIEAYQSTVNQFARVKHGERYFYISSDCRLCSTTEYGDNEDFWRHRAGNYCTNPDLMNQRMLHENLNRLLWRFSEKNGGDEEWSGKNTHWHIYYDTIKSEFGFVLTDVIKEQGMVYFKSRSIAEKAVQEVIMPFMTEHPNFVW